MALGFRRPSSGLPLALGNRHAPCCPFAEPLLVVSMGGAVRAHACGLHSFVGLPFQPIIFRQSLVWFFHSWFCPSQLPSSRRGSRQSLITWRRAKGRKPNETTTRKKKKDFRVFSAHAMRRIRRLLVCMAETHEREGKANQFRSHEKKATKTMNDFR